MKILELDLKKKVLIVDENDFDYYELSENGIYFKLEKGDRYYLGWKFEVLCKGSELTEEIASELVEEHYMSGVRSYEIYNDYRYNDARWLDNALESFISAVESKEKFWLVNPLGEDPKKNKLLGTRIMRIMNMLKYQEWQEAEEKTFKNPLIFVKNYV